MNYPLQLWDENDRCVMDTVDYLMKNCLVLGGFFHDLSHSGINPYLTLHIAQVLLRCGGNDFFKLAEAVADLASPAGMRPEAVHPQTKGGCMGDGQHVWAAAEWILMMRNSFVREEEKDGRLILFGGIPFSWYREKGEISFGPAPTTYGPISVSLKSDGKELSFSWSGDWFEREPNICLSLPDAPSIKIKRGQTCAAFPVNGVTRKKE